MEWSKDLEEWLYGPPSDEDDELESVGEMYRRQEEEDRLRWIPGYRETVEEYLSLLHQWRATYWRGRFNEPLPERAHYLYDRISEWQKQRAVPPWESAAS